VTEYRWPDGKALLALTSKVLEGHGHKMSIRSEADLDAGLERARTASRYAPNCDIADLAALMFEGLASRHPLVDGNKRLAFIAMITFLRINGRYLDAKETDAYDAAIALIEKRMKVDGFAQFVRSNLIADTKTGS
jgi:death-on-curing protein